MEFTLRQLLQDILKPLFEKKNFKVAEVIQSTTARDGEDIV